MALKMSAQRHNLRDLYQQIQSCGELTPPRSDSSEPSLSPAPAPPSPPSPSSVKDDPDALHNLHPVSTSSIGGMKDHTRLTLCGFMLLFLAFNPLGILMNNIGRFNYDYVNTKLDGRTILNYPGNKRTWIIYFFPICKNDFDIFFYNILETGPFYIKIMRFAGFFRVQIHSWKANVS